MKQVTFDYVRYIYVLSIVHTRVLNTIYVQSNDYWSCYAHFNFLEEVNIPKAPLTAIV